MQTHIRRSFSCSDWLHQEVGSSSSKGRLMHYDCHSCSRNTEHNCCSNEKRAVDAVVGTGCNGLGTGADAAERRRVHIHWQDYQHSLPHCCDDCLEDLQTCGMKGIHEGQNSRRQGGGEHDNYSARTAAVAFAPGGGGDGDYLFRTDNHWSQHPIVS